MAKLGAPGPLLPEYNADTFDSGEPSLDDWLRKRALANASAGASRTFVVCEGERVAAYYALAVGAVELRAATGRVRRNMPDPIPVIVIGRLAVDRGQQGKGLARALVKDAIIRALNVSQDVGVRALLVHALNERAAAFWSAVGFLPSPLDARTLMISLTDAATILRDQV